MRTLLGKSIALCGFTWLIIQHVNRPNISKRQAICIPMKINDSNIGKMKHDYEIHHAKHAARVRYSDYPPPRIQIEGRDVTFDISKPDFYGSASVCFVSKDKTKVMKFITASDESFKNAISREKAVLGTMGDSLADIAPHVYPIEDERLKLSNPGCLGLIMVTSYLGEKTLCDAEKMKLPKSVVSRVAAKIIAMVRQIHSLGIIHGDISCKNFVFKGERIEDMLESLRVVDFGFSEHYSENQIHVEQGFSRVELENRTKWQLSPFELREISPSRRDDMYRVSAILYLLLGGSYPLMGWNRDPSDESLAEAKIKWRAPLFAPRVFTDFHHEMVNLDFKKQPDYDKWIKLFSDT
jgi:serine/threonine protein kinase